MRAPTRSSKDCATATTRCSASGSRRERSSSIGEWQKVALARAFVRDAEILVFDEPTSALDPTAEWKAFEHIRELAKGRAVILISHRFSTVRMADRIHILEHGRIVESGSHDELMALDERYARMYEVQARAYRMDPELE